MNSHESRALCAPGHIILSLDSDSIVLACSITHRLSQLQIEQRYWLVHEHGGQGCCRDGSSLLLACGGWTRAGGLEDSISEDTDSDRSRVSRWTLQAAATEEGATIVNCT
jgi:hypothetical protein